MLQALNDLAKREHLVGDSNYEKRRVDFFIRLDDAGHALALVPTADAAGRAGEFRVPSVPKRTVAVAPGVLFDNAKYVLGIGDEGDKPERLILCQQAFAAQLAELAAGTDDVGVAAVRGFLEHLDIELPRLLAWRPRAEWTGGEWLAFVRDADGTTAVHDRPAVREALSRQRAEGGEQGTPTRCLVTGEVEVPARLHGALKLGGLDHAQTSGVSLVSFNAAAFTSHGLEQGANAPVSRAAAIGYVTALNWLLEGTPSRRHRYGVSLGSEAVTVFWSREACETADLFASLLDPSPEEAIRVAESISAGLAPSDLDVTPFYAVTLSANASRVVVRDWLETTVGDVKAHVRLWFNDLQLGAAATPLPIWRLLKSVESPGGNGLSPALGARLFAAAFRGRPIPREVLAAALRRLRLPPDKKDERNALHARCALVKATLLRLSRSGQTTLKEVSVALDESNVDVPYLLGRLFAVLERLQTAALGADVNTTIRDRWFGAASSTPSLVFPRLLALSVHHARKATSGGWLEGSKGRIIAALPAAQLPRKLSLEEQGLFAIGYYHQREKFFEKRVTAEAAELTTVAA